MQEDCGNGPLAQASPIEIAQVPYARPVPPRPRIWPVFVALPAALLLGIVLQTCVGFVLGFVHALGPGGGGASPSGAAMMEMLQTPLVMIGFFACVQIAFLLVAIVALRETREPAREQLGLLRAHVPWWGFAAFVVGSFLVACIGMLGAAPIEEWLGTGLDANKLREQFDWISGPLFVVLIGLMPGFVEELFFRGFIQRRLLRRWPPAVAIGVTSVLFAVAHLDPTYVVFALPLGIWFGVIAWRTGSIWPTIACHMAVNSLVNVYATPFAKGAVSEGVEVISGILILFAGVCGFVAALVVLVRRRVPVARPVGLDAPALRAENGAAGQTLESFDPGV